MQSMEESTGCGVQTTQNTRAATLEIYMEIMRSLHKETEVLNAAKPAAGQTVGAVICDTEDEDYKDLRAIQILSDVLPKVVANVPLNQEELLPLMMCAIEHHPDCNTRDSLTRTLFNLIKRPNEQQRQAIIEVCVTLAKNVGEIRTETELLPQCWEQINHMHEEHRLLAAQSCGQLAEFVRPEIRGSLILSILKQLLEDSADDVREAAVCNLALVLPLFPNTDMYSMVEEVMFRLIRDPSGGVVETTMKKLVPALLNCGIQLDHILPALLSNILSSIKCCPLLSGVEDSAELHFHVLGERERLTVDVLLKLLFQLLPLVHQESFNTCPYPSLSDCVGKSFPKPLLEKYSEEPIDWPIFEWLHDDCFPSLIHIASLLPQQEDSLRSQISSFLLEVSKRYGDDYLTHIMLPVFLTSVGGDADLACFPSKSQSKVKALSPKTVVDERIASACVLPVLLAGVLGSSSMLEVLREYMRNLLVQNLKHDGQSTRHQAGIYNSVRFLCVFRIRHNPIFNILREMVLIPDMDVKVEAAKLMKVIVPYIDAKDVSVHILPALVTLGSESNLRVLYATIDAFGTVAQNFRNDVIVDRIWVQMDAFLEYGSPKIMIAALRALVVAVPHTTESLRNYLLSKIYYLSANKLAASNIIVRHQIGDAFCEVIRALDATDLCATRVQEFLLPTVQNLLKEIDVLDPAHKVALKIIAKERSSVISYTFSMVIGCLLSMMARSIDAVKLMERVAHKIRHHQM